MDINIIKSKSVPILKSYGIKRAFIFGSYARGEQTLNSDIDFLIEYAPNIRKSLLKRIELKLALEDVLQRKVDIVTENSLSPHIRPYVLKDRLVIM